MAFEKNTVDFLKEYAIRYKKILYGILILIGFLISKNLYNKYSFFRFNQSITQVNEGIINNSLDSLNIFYDKHFSKIINHKSIFVASYVYINGIKILYKKLPQKLHNFVDEGRWIDLSKTIESIDIQDKNHILNHLKILENIYQFTKKRIPYTCVLNSKDIHYYGEILNVIILIHMVHREKIDDVTYFYHKGCLHVSLYKTYTAMVYNYYLNPKNSLDMNIFPSKTKINLLKKFLNF